MKYLSVFLLLAFSFSQISCSVVRYQSGIASWYGKDFHGKITANGEKYNMYAMTAAHRTLPLGTVVRVTNLSNKKKVKVRINDRGPYVGNRVIDLSYAAAKKIDMLHAGIGKVKIDIFGGKKTPPSFKATNSAQDVQIGVASWYGKNLHGKITANGEKYNMYAMTAAHKTLPFGTVIKVTNFSNKRKVKVRINDRNTCVNNRIITLSYAAAKKLRILDIGITEVRIDILG